MKRIISILILTIMFSTVSYAGQWKEDGYGYKYQNNDGVYKTGWHQDVDTKWYYLDTNSGYMLSNTTTPDGYLVSSDGSWVEGGVNNTGNVLKDSYENKIELEVMSYENGPKMIKEIGYSLPVTVYYNNVYIFEHDRKVSVSGIETSENGVLYVKYFMNQMTYDYELKTICKYILEDGTYLEKDRVIQTFYSSDEEGKEYSGTLMRWPQDAKSKPVSAEIYINVGDAK